jgi:hypothetical protein
MGKYKYQIYTTGFAHEIVVGNISEEDVVKINELCDENDLSIIELYEDSDLLSENELSEWFENDNKEHIYGSSIDESLLNVVDMTNNETIIEKDFYSLKGYELEKCEFDLVEHDYEDEPIFLGSTTEKGVPMLVDLDLDEIFDESKLTFKALEISIGDYYYEVVSELYYDGELLYTDVDSTDYKDFIVSVID